MFQSLNSSNGRGHMDGEQLCAKGEAGTCMVCCTALRTDRLIIGPRSAFSFIETNTCFIANSCSLIFSSGFVVHCNTNFPFMNVLIQLLENGYSNANVDNVRSRVLPLEQHPVFALCIRTSKK